MIKRKQPSLSGQSLNPQHELLALLQTQCPEVFTEGKIDTAKLRATLGEVVDADGERYSLSWAGKSDCFRHIQEPTTATLVPDHKASVDFEGTKNIFIEGDNLQALKVLQKSYYGKMKMIYIDPPYNTGSDSFIYPDRFQESKEEYMKRIGQKEEGHLTRDGMWQTNSKDNGHYHSNWLNMMHPRLFLARNLLRQDGVIFVSIDDHEVHNLRMIMNEIFGETNFVALFPWKKRTTKSDVPNGVSQDYEWIICYTKADFLAGIEHERKYYQTEDFPNDRWRLADLTKQTTAEERPNSAFDLIDPKTGKKYAFNPKRSWAISKDTFNEYYQRGKIVFPDDYNFLRISIPAFRVFESEDKAKAVKKYGKEDVMKAVSTFLPKEIGMNEDGNKEISTLFNEKIFSFPKPISLLKYLVEFSTNENENDIILDFFAGSGTTAHAVMALNAEDGGTRQCISIQLAEPCDEESEAKKAGFNTIADIARERIRRAGKKIKEDTGAKIDYGFKAFTLDESNFKIWRSDVGNAEGLAKQMEMFIDNVKKDSTQENILYELMLKTGLDLNTPTEKVATKAGTYFKLSGGKLVVCIEQGMTEELADKVLAEKPEKFICLDKAFGGNDQLKTNVLLQMEQAGVDFLVI